jgi:hypothetical protein
MSNSLFKNGSFINPGDDGVQLSGMLMKSNLKSSKLSEKDNLISKLKNALNFSQLILQ